MYQEDNTNSEPMVAASVNGAGSAGPNQMNPQQLIANYEAKI